MGQRSMLIIMLGFLIASCSNINEEYLVGEWYNESIRVDIDALDGEADSIFSVPAGSWEEVLQIKPISTTFRQDGTYLSVYYNLDGSVLQESSGVWKMKRDSLYLTQEGQTTGYLFQWQQGKGLFEGYLDWDTDGHEDDFYSGVQIKK